MNNFESKNNLNLGILEWLSFFDNTDFQKLTSLEQQLYILIYLHDAEDILLSVSKAKMCIKKGDATIRKAIKKLEEKGIIKIKRHLATETNRELNFIYLKQKLNIKKAK